MNPRRRRTVLSAELALGVNIVYALCHGVYGVLTTSLWFVTMGVYYAILGAARFSAVLCRSSSDQGTEYFVMKISGVLLIILSAVLAGVVYISLSRNIAAKYGTIAMISIAAYVFGKLGAAAARGFRQRRDPSPLLAVIRGISYAEVAGSVLTLQRSMLVSFDSMSAADALTMNALTGAAASLFVLAVGITMTVKGIRKGSNISGNIKTCKGK